ncbi:hypothetical protein [Actinacidiphila sp. bgisy160]|uniref:hypothetical protein n=1 Tax=Actinacidiphila sp. bgisy160 TaxID=3413796 RepID=UPI003D759513
MTKKTVQVLTGLLLMASAGVACTSGRGTQAGPPSPSSSPALPAGLCGTSVSTKPIALFHQPPRSEVVETESGGGGLKAPLTERSVGEDGEYCSLLIDGEAVQIRSALREDLIDEQAVAQRVRAGGAALDWGPARGYVTSGGGTELAALTAPCTLAGTAPGQGEKGGYALYISVAAPALREGEEEARKAREAMAELAADAARYVAGHSAKCLDADALPRTAPTLKRSAG